MKLSPKLEYYINYSLFSTDVVQYDANIQLKEFYGNGQEEEINSDVEQAIVQLLQKVAINSRQAFT